MNREKELRLLKLSGTVSAAAHILLLFFGLRQMDGDALIVLRDTAISPPLINVVLAAAEVAALLMMGGLVCRFSTPRGNRILRRYWLLSLALALLWACYPLPSPPVITYQADSVFFHLLPVYVVTPQFALQILLYCVFPLLGGAAKAWLLQFGGAAFAAVQVVYLLLLTLRSRRSERGR